MHLSIILVVGARPNFVKVAPLLHALAELDGVRPSLLHTGQHYDWALSQAFIEQLGLPEPEDYLNVGSGSHAEQTAGVLVGVERVLKRAPTRRSRGGRRRELDHGGRARGQ